MSTMILAWLMHVHPLSRRSSYTSTLSRFDEEIGLLLGKWSWPSWNGTAAHERYVIEYIPFITQDRLVWRYDDNRMLYGSYHALLASSASMLLPCNCPQWCSMMRVFSSVTTDDAIYQKFTRTGIWNQMMVGLSIVTAVAEIVICTGLGS